MPQGWSAGTYRCAMSAGDGPAECVINISEGRDLSVIEAIASTAGPVLADIHTDPDHHRSVLTLVGTLSEVADAARSVARAAVERIDLETHRGVHPRLGALDVVPFVPLTTSDGRTTSWAEATEARDGFAQWAGQVLDLPCFLYGPERTLPELRRQAFHALAPDTGPGVPHPTAGAAAVGVRGVLIAYNVWLTADTSVAFDSVDGSGADSLGPRALATAKIVAGQLRRPGLRTLGLGLGDQAQVSCNVTDPDVVALAQVFDEVAEAAASNGCVAVRGEVVGLVPHRALADAPENRWSELGLSTVSTIESHLGDSPRR